MKILYALALRASQVMMRRKICIKPCWIIKRMNPVNNSTFFQSQESPVNSVKRDCWHPRLDAAFDGARRTARHSMGTSQRATAGIDRALGRARLPPRLAGRKQWRNVLRVWRAIRARWAPPALGRAGHAFAAVQRADAPRLSRRPAVRRILRARLGELYRRELPESGARWPPIFTTIELPHRSGRRSATARLRSSPSTGWRPGSNCRPATRSSGSR